MRHALHLYQRYSEIKNNLIESRTSIDLAYLPLKYLLCAVQRARGCEDVKRIVTRNPRLQINVIRIVVS